MKFVACMIARCKIVRLLTIGLVAFSFACSEGTDSKPVETGTAKPVNRAEEIVAEHVKREAVPFRKDNIRFTIREEGEKTQVIEIDAWRRHEGDTTTTLSIVTKPAEDAGTGTLTVEEKGKPTVITTYSVSRDEFRDTDTGKMFFGGLTAQELLGEWGKYSYKFIGESGGFEVEGKLKQGETSVIDTTKVTFNRETFLPVEMHLFDNTGKEMRVFKSSEPRTVGGHTFFARTEVINHIYKSEISIEILSRDYPEKLGGSIFTKEKLKESAKK